MTIQIDSVLQSIESQLGDAPFINASVLINPLGLFATSNSLNKAIESGRLPAVKISEHRTVIPKAAVAQFIRDNLTTPKG